MLGNDIVDLYKAAKESNWQRKGYLNKIFTPAEQIAIHNSSDPNITVWLFWSMKEAVYKISNRQSLIRIYNPQRIECKLVSVINNNADGLVSYNGNLYFTKSNINTKFIYTVASQEISYLRKIKTQYLSNTKNYLNSFKIKSGYSIQKNLFGVPHINHDLKINNAVSISHHGRYLAIAY